MLANVLFNVILKSVSHSDLHHATTSLKTTAPTSCLSNSGTVAVSLSWDVVNSCALIVWLFLSITRCNLRHSRRFFKPCFSSCQRPTPNIFKPVLSLIMLRCSSLLIFVSSGISKILARLLMEAYHVLIWPELSPGFASTAGAVEA